MKIYYLNDETDDLRVRVLHGILPNGECDDEYFTLRPHEGRMFSVRAPEGAAPYMKRWDYRLILLTFLPAESIAQFEESNSKDSV
jgi:hypothetical protein